MVPLNPDVRSEGPLNHKVFLKAKNPSTPKLGKDFIAIHHVWSLLREFAAIRDSANHDHSLI